MNSYPYRFSPPFLPPFQPGDSPGGPGYQVQGFRVQVDSQDREDRDFQVDHHLKTVKVVLRALQADRHRQRYRS